MTTDTERAELIELLRNQAEGWSDEGAAELALLMERAVAYIESHPPVDVSEATALLDKWMDGYDHLGTGGRSSERASEKEWECDRNKIIAAMRPVDAAVEKDAWKHVANEWADVATNGAQWLKNVRDGISSFDEAIADMQRGFSHCREVQDTALTAQQQEERANG